MLPAGTGQCLAARGSRTGVNAGLRRIRRCAEARICSARRRYDACTEMPTGSGVGRQDSVRCDGIQVPFFTRRRDAVEDTLPSTADLQRPRANWEASRNIDLREFPQAALDVGPHDGR